MKIKNVIFDIGNVIVHWAPHIIVSTIFPNLAEELRMQMNLVSLELNKGRLTLEEAMERLNVELGLDKEKLTKLMEELKTHQTPIPGTIELLEELKNNKEIDLYAITDSIRESIEYHREHSNFLSYFKDIVTSFDLGTLKPDPIIYQSLIDKYQLNPEESVFIDDTEKNVEGAKNIGMKAIHFKDAKSCRDELIKLGVIQER